MTGIFGEPKESGKLPPFHTRILASQTGDEDFTRPEPIISGGPKEEKAPITVAVLEQQHENILHGNFSETNNAKAESIFAPNSDTAKRIVFAVNTNGGVLVYLYPKNELDKIAQQNRPGVEMLKEFDEAGNCALRFSFMGTKSVIIFLCVAVALNAAQTEKFIQDPNLSGHLAEYQELGISPG